MWAYYFNTAIDHNLALWPSIPTYIEFLGSWQELPNRPVQGLLATDVDAWQAATDSIVKLCRGESTASFELPSDAHFFQATLPGYEIGWGAIPADEVCIN
jgi:hypothetical protein